MNHETLFIYEEALKSALRDLHDLRLKWLVRASLRAYKTAKWL